VNQWDIFTWDDHPAVILSHPERVASKPAVNILSCSTQRAGRPPGPGEVLLDRADGLDWETLCRCDLIYAVEKADLRQRRGSVAPERRRQIVRAIIQAFGWNAI